MAKTYYLTLDEFKQMLGITIEHNIVIIKPKKTKKKKKK